MRPIKILLVTLLVFITNEAFAGVAPIKNMPEYNGTYWGSPGTGGDCEPDHDGGHGSDGDGNWDGD